MTLFALLAAFVACTPYTGTGPKETVVCLSSPDASLVNDREDYTYDVEGTFHAASTEGFEPTLGCYGLPDQAFVVEDDEGVEWTVAFAVYDDVADGIAPLDTAALESTRVSLHYRTMQSFGAANGFVLSQEDRLVAAVESGTWGSALGPEDTPGLAVTTGNALYTSGDDCGTRRFSEMVFHGDGVANLAPLEVGDLSIGGSLYDAFAVQNSAYTDLQCTDTAGDWMWAIVAQ